jgi:hypothetical protein
LSRHTYPTQIACEGCVRLVASLSAARYRQSLTVDSSTRPAAPTLPTRPTRFAIALGTAIAAGLYVWAYARANPDFVSDFDQVWAGARGLWHHQDPYHLVGPRGAFLWKWPLYYPLPALLIAAPLGLMPLIAARVIFAAFSAGSLAYALSRDGYAPLLSLLSISFVTAVELVQWSPLLTAGMLLPSLAWTGIAKPNLGATMAAYWSSRQTMIAMAIGSAALVAVSFVVQPNWAAEWWANVRSAPHFVAPILRPGGILLLVVLAKWRRPEARLLAALACVPQTPTFYDHVFVFVVPRTSREVLALVVLTFAVYFAVAFAAPFTSFQQWGDFVAAATILFVYAPAVIMVLRRPNHGPVPRIVERLVARLRPGSRERA